MQVQLAIGRPILWDYPWNRFAVIGSAVGTVAVVVARIVGGRPVTFGNVIATFAALFLAWAMGREIDPDENLSAGVALVLALLAVFEFGFPSLWLVAGLVVGVRLVVGTVGLALGVVDAVALSALGAYVGYRYMSWIVIGVIVIGVVLVGVIASGGLRRVALWLVVPAGCVVGLALSHTSAGLVMPGGGTLVVAASVVAAGLILIGGPAPESMTDVHPRPIQRYRLVTGRVAATIAVVVVSFQAGTVAAVSPVAASLVAAAGVRLVSVIRKELKDG